MKVQRQYPKTGQKESMFLAKHCLSQGNLVWKDGTWICLITKGIQSHVLKLKQDVYLDPRSSPRSNDAWSVGLTVTSIRLRPWHNTMLGELLTREMFFLAVIHCRSCFRTQTVQYLCRLSMTVVGYATHFYLENCITVLTTVTAIIKRKAEVGYTLVWWSIKLLW